MARLKRRWYATVACISEIAAGAGTQASPPGELVLVARLSIERFRGVKSATLDFTGHTLFVGANNVGKVFTTEAVKEAGKQFGKWAPRAFWLWLFDMMFGVSQAVHAWLQALGAPF